jgi:protein-S-isoprenylcysteine O-methyltransferase Ste14
MGKEKMPWLVAHTKPPIIALGILLLMILTDKVAPVRILQFPSKIPGTIIFFLGIALVVWAASLFRKAHTDLLPTGKSTALVVRGPFIHTRNPMYLGMTVSLVGGAIWMGTLWAFAGPLAFAAIINVTFIPYEEKKMTRIFGKKYVAYTKKVRRWV